MPVIRTHTLEHEGLIRPALDESLWRYMEFGKFVAMLVNEGLYLSRLDRLGDKYEGWVPKPPKGYYRGFFEQEFMERDSELKKQSGELKTHFFMNCWHASDEQSDAMWKLYSDGAVKSQTANSIRIEPVG